MMKSLSIVFLVALIALLESTIASVPVNDKACEDIQKRFACRARADCKWYGGFDECRTEDPNATFAPTIFHTTKKPTTGKPTVPPADRTKRPTMTPTVKRAKTRRPSASPAVKTRKPTMAPNATKAPTLKKCSDIVLKKSCETGFGLGRCEWFQDRCMRIRTAKPSVSPTLRPSASPTTSPTRSPTFHPTRSPIKSKTCADFKSALACCGKKFAEDKSKVCKNDDVPAPGCKWKVKNVPRPVCVRGAGTSAPSSSAPSTPRVLTVAPTLLITQAPAKKTTTPAPSKKKTTSKPTKRPTRRGETLAPTLLGEYEYEDYYQET